MQSKKIWRIVWITSIYAVLITILYLVVIYKVKWEDKDLAKYLYFYNCGNGELCTTDGVVKEYYSRIKCDNDICPRIIDKRDNIVIIGNDNENYIYDYLNSITINDSYIRYRFTSQNGYYIAYNDNKYGVIDNNQSIIVKFEYDNINDYIDNIITYSKDNDMYIKDLSVDDYQNIIKYKNIYLFTKDKYIYLDDEGYYIANVKDGKLVNNTIYDFIYPVNNVLLIVKNSELDIIDNNLKSKLSKKIKTYYTYTSGEEWSSLNIKVIDNLLHFDLVNDTETVKYTYDLEHNKLYG